MMISQSLVDRRHGIRAVLKALVAGGLVVACLVAPATAQNLEALVSQNQALMQQNAELIKQNAALMRLIEANRAQLEQLQRGAGQRAGSPQQTASRAHAAATPKSRPAPEAKPKNVVASGNRNVRLTLAGQINRALLVTDDGGSSDVFHVDNDNNSTRIGFVGEADFDAMTIGTNLEVEFESNSTTDIDQNNQSTGTEFKERKIEIYAKHNEYGKLSMGQGSTASDGTSEADLSGTGVVAYSDVNDMAGGLFFRRSDGTLTTSRINNVSTNMDGLGRDDRIRYDTPKFFGLSGAASFASNDKWDAAMKFAGQFGAFKTVAALGYAEPKGTIDYRLSGSGSVLHENGLSFTLAAGREERDTTGRDDPSFVYAKLGYIADWQRLDVPSMAKIGNTAIAFDYQRTEDSAQNGDEFNSYGLVAVQNVDRLSTDIYFGLRLHELERSGADIDDIWAMITGARVKF